MMQPPPRSRPSGVASCCRRYKREKYLLAFVSSGVAKSTRHEITMQLNRADYEYVSCYCEENVYRLIQRQPSLDGWFAIFLSNATKKVPVWQQRSAGPSGHVIWDYHVIACYVPPSAGSSSCEAADAAVAPTTHVATRSEKAVIIYDFDTVLPWPCDADVYISQSLKASDYPELKEEFLQIARVCSARDLLCHFASDRRHMPPETRPSTPCIMARDGRAHTLPSFLDMLQEDAAPGVLCRPRRLLQHLRSLR